MQRPLAIIVGSSALALAIAAGITESVLAVAHVATTSGLSPGDDVQIGVRSIVYAAGLALTVLLYRGHGWARWAVMIMIGLLWLGTLIIPMAGELAGGSDPGAVFGGDVNPVFPVVRALHLVLAPVGLAASFRRSASAFVASRPGRAQLVR